LPTELRLAVYFELLVTDNRLVVKWQGPRKKEVQQKPIYTSILRASKQCRDEGLTVLYGENIFDMGEYIYVRSAKDPHLFPYKS
jgi:hypothetical protein